jgi:CheY-like chemotaxis protein
VVTQVGHELEGRCQTLDLRLPEDALPVDADPTRLRQVFANLLNNASRYSPPGSAVTLSAERGGAGVLVRVRDQGQGMTRETLERVFEPFWQGSGRERHGGFGIGLTLAHRLVEMHGGRIDARSDGPGLGSELLVDLPLSEQPRAVAPAPARPADADGRRVLVIDDNRDLAFGIRLLLGRQGYAVELAGDGAQGIAAAERKRPDVILLDIGLPDIDGFEVARRLRRLPGLNGVRLIGMSGFGGDDHHRRSQAAGIDRYLTKPVTACPTPCYASPGCTTTAPAYRHWPTRSRASMNGTCRAISARATPAWARRSCTTRTCWTPSRALPSGVTSFRNVTRC